MKKLIVLFVLVLVAFSGKVGAEMNYVTVDGKTYFSEDVKVGFSNVKIGTEDGLTVKAPLKKVDALMVEGKLWERLPVYCCKGKYMGTELLEFVTQRNDLRLYKYHSDDCKLGCGFIDDTDRETRYFLYKDGKIYLRVDQRNAETVFDFFGVQYKTKG
jgi:hypothetical protein